MAITVRLSRSGVRNNPFYRIVVVYARKKSAGNIKEQLGYWQPKKALLKIDKKKIGEWAKKGAIVSPAVTKLCAN